MRTVLGLDPEADSDEVEQRLTEVVERVDPTLVPWLPLIGILLGLELPPTPETRSLDGRFLREQLTEVAMRFLVSTLAGTPTMLAVEDVQLHRRSEHGSLAAPVARAGSELRQMLARHPLRPRQGLGTHRRRRAAVRSRSRSSSCCSSALLTKIVEHVTEDEPLVAARHRGDRAADRARERALPASSWSTSCARRASIGQPARLRRVDDRRRDRPAVADGSSSAALRLGARMRASTRSCWSAAVREEVLRPWSGRPRVARGAALQRSERSRGLDAFDDGISRPSSVTVAFQCW